MWHSRGYPEKLNATLHRYCDDAILVCRKSASLALEKFTELVRRLSLIINHQKTRITKLKEGFNFIGFYFVKNVSSRLDYFFI
ncbi:hypothetical protein [Cardinium endosymbiont of Oedothorax gibbosus]|uniref:hypothetical protein n=1 Tax=Cardinium endosymbiont of Oedothorax gibbosus TaxID=931101 RepID=UPI0020255A94|nr:hypothetical protein [Cardinium endosymbiont of Oedothorax gibbosus]